MVLFTLNFSVSISVCDTIRNWVQHPFQHLRLRGRKRNHKHSVWTGPYQECNSVRDRTGIYSQNQYLFQKNKSWPMLKDRAKWILHWNFDSLILSCHTWNILKKCPSQIFTACRSDLDTSWKCFMCDSSELSCWIFYNGSQWLFMIFQC